jgi:hypothetical protein
LHTQEHHFWNERVRKMNTGRVEGDWRKCGGSVEEVWRKETLWTMGVI